MDGLSGASGVVAIVSFALQLADGARKLYNFWSSVEEAPESIRRIAVDLKLLSNVLTEIAHHGQKYGHDSSVTDVLESCTQDLKEMTDMTQKLEREMLSGNRKKWSAIKAVFKSDKINKFQARLMDAKSTLILARQTLLDKSIHKYFDHSGEMLTAMTQGIAVLEKQSTHMIQASTRISNEHMIFSSQELQALVDRVAAQVANPFIRSGFKAAIEAAVKDAVDTRDSGSYISTSQEQSQEIERATIHPLQTSRRKRFWISQEMKSVECMFGKLIVQRHLIHSTMYHGSNLDNSSWGEESEIRLIFRPAAWLLRLGLAYELRLAFFATSSSWKQSYQVLQPVRDDSLIFEFCRTGNLEGVKALLFNKSASVWDVDSHGWTPLLFAAHTHMLGVCQLLVNQGADLNAVSYRGLSCIQLFLGCQEAFNVLSYQLVRSKEAYKFLDQMVQKLQFFVSRADDMSWFSSYKVDPDAFRGPCCDDYMPRVGEISISETMMALPGIMDYMIRGVARILQVHHPHEPWIWDLVLSFELPISTVKWAVRTYQAFINMRYSPEDYSPITRFIRYGKWDVVELLAKNGADLHHVGVETKHSPVPESAISVSLYSSVDFYAWKSILQRLGVDLQRLVDAEMKNGRLQKDGWDIQSLKVLFDLKFRPPRCFENRANSTCAFRDYPKENKKIQDYEEIQNKVEDSNSQTGSACGQESGIMVEIDWQKLLHRIRQKKSLKGYVEQYLEDSDSDTESYDCDANRQTIRASTSSDDMELHDSLENCTSSDRRENSLASKTSPYDDGNDENPFEDSESVEHDLGEGQLKWCCVKCWYRECRDNSKLSSPSLKKEDDEDEELSPLLLDINI